MPPSDLFLLFTTPIESAGLRYMVSGSVASMAYGEPRLTNDVDLVLALDVDDVHELAAAFPLEHFYCPPEEVIALEARRPQRGHFNIIHHGTGHKADIYTVGRDPLLAWGLANRRSIEVSTGVSVWLAPPEYVILQKLSYYREGHSEKHLLDIRGMLEVSAELADEDFLQEQIEALQLGDAWEKVKP